MTVRWTSIRRKWKYINVMPIMTMMVMAKLMTAEFPQYRWAHVVHFLQHCEGIIVFCSPSHRTLWCVWLLWKICTFFFREKYLIWMKQQRSRLLVDCGYLWYAISTDWLMYVALTGDENVAKWIFTLRWEEDINYWFYQHEDKGMLKVVYFRTKKGTWRVFLEITLNLNILTK